MFSRNPPDVEELPNDHEFFDELAELVEEYEGEELDRKQLLYATNTFGEYWVNQLAMTGETW